MDGRPLKIKLEDLPDNLESVPDDTLILWEDKDELSDNAFWCTDDAVDS